MTFGIVVEGPTDEAAYSILIPRIRPAVEKVESRACGGKSPLLQKFVGFLEDFGGLSVEKALVIRDSDCHDPRMVEAKLQQKLVSAGFAPPFPLHFYATKCMLDTWLLADEDAVNQVAQQRGKRTAAKRAHDPLEGKRDGKTLFRRMLSQVQLPATPAVYGEVSKAVDIERIKQRCLYFLRFVECVHGC
jgi:hypothetical protein